MKKDTKFYSLIDDDLVERELPVLYFDDNYNQPYSGKVRATNYDEGDMSSRDDNQ